VLLASLLSAVSAPGLFGQASVTRPVEEFGFELGADYHLASYAQLERYWVKLADESDRMSLETIGESAEGRPIYMAVITSPENQRNLGRYREISRRLALARGVDEDEARALAAEGRAVVWIDGGLHATETLGAQQLMEMVYRMVSRSDAETLRLLDETILLAVCPNPDGLDLVADWYMREPVPSARSLDGLPRLYQKYAGHDNNRDFFMSSQPETQAINRVLYREWFPQIVYNHHQTAPEGTVLFAPPFRDPSQRKFYIHAEEIFLFLFNDVSFSPLGKFIFIDCWFRCSIKIHCQNWLRNSITVDFIGVYLKSLSFFIGKFQYLFKSYFIQQKFETCFHSAATFSIAIKNTKQAFGKWNNLIFMQKFISSHCQVWNSTKTTTNHCARGQGVDRVQLGAVVCSNCGREAALRVASVAFAECSLGEQRHLQARWQVEGKCQSGHPRSDHHHVVAKLPPRFIKLAQPGLFLWLRLYDPINVPQAYRRHRSAAGTVSATIERS
jgi:hypothetical protein